MSTATQTTLETYLIDLWESSDLYAGAEVRPHEDGMLYTAWDMDQQRVCLKFIVDGEVTKSQFDDLSIDLVLLLHAESDKMRDQEIADGKDEAAAADLANGYGPYYMDVYLSVRDHAAIRKANLLGIYAPELFLHFVPIHNSEGGAA